MRNITFSLLSRLQTALLFLIVAIPHFCLAIIDTITISGNPPLMTISTATAGSNPNPVTDTSTTYTGVAVLSTRISGALNSAMPTGVTLKVQLQAMAGGTSTGLQTMTTTATNLVTGIPALSLWPNLTITYQLSATVAAAIQSNTSRTLTLTLQ